MMLIVGQKYVSLVSENECNLHTYVHEIKIRVRINISLVSHNNNVYKHIIIEILYYFLMKSMKKIY